MRMEQDVVDGRKGRIRHRRLNVYIFGGDENRDGCAHGKAQDTDVRSGQTLAGESDGGTCVRELIVTERQWRKIAFTTATKVEEKHVVTGSPQARTNAKQILLYPFMTCISDDHPLRADAGKPPAAQYHAVFRGKAYRLERDANFPRGE